MAKRPPSTKASNGGQLDPPAYVQLGPLTQQLLSGARWSGADQFPAWQVWADDVEEVLTFLEREGRLANFLTVARKAATPQHRDAYLAEARGAFHLARKGFRIVQWEPPGDGTTKGEALVSLAGAPDIFVEVKQPGWQGEHVPRRIGERKALSPEGREQCYARTKMEKYLEGDGGPVAPQTAAMDVVRRNALPKLTDKCPNLVVVVDDLKVTAVGLPGLAEFVQREFSKPDRDPDDPNDVFTYERLGGVLFLHPEPEEHRLIYYHADFVANPGVLATCALPQPVIAILSKMRDESRLKTEQRYANRPSIFDILKRDGEQSAQPGA